MIIIGSGSRDWLDHKPIQKVMYRLMDIHNNFMYYHGDQRGFDTLSKQQLRLLGHPKEQIKAFPYVRELGKAGGMVRNRNMLAEALSIDDNVMLIAMPLAKSIGTYGMISICKSAKIVVEVYDIEGNIINESSK
jgi:hypothetical protein